VVDDERGNHRAGLWWADLSTVGDHEIVLPTVAEALGLCAEAAVPLTEVIVDHVADRHALLVLDGCEPELAEVVDLVLVLRAACPHLAILTTSRQVLGVSGEAVVRVPPLTVPPAGGPATPEALPQYESVALFVDRASLAGSDFRLTDDNASAVAELCRALEGIPLALELAAARSAALSPAAMLEQMSDHLRLLDDGYVDAPERHRSGASTYPSSSSRRWSDICSSIAAGDSAGLRAAASSSASGMPSSARHSSAIAAALSSVSRRSDPASALRSTNSETASYCGRVSGVTGIPGAGRVSAGTRTTASPLTPRT